MRHEGLVEIRHREGGRELRQKSDNTSRGCEGEKNLLGPWPEYSKERDSNGCETRALQGAVNRGRILDFMPSGVESH